MPIQPAHLKKKSLFLKNKLSRRNALKRLGAMGVAPMMLGATSVEFRDETNRDSSPSRNSRASSGIPDLHRISSGKMTVDFDKDPGTIFSITGKQDPLGINFVGNRINTRGVALGDTHWSGDVVATVWHLDTPDWVREQPSDPWAVHRRSGRWRRESTVDSDDIRRVSFDRDTLNILSAAQNHPILS